MNGRTGPVTATDSDICQRLKDLRCYTIDGEAFYRLRDVFDALEVPMERAARRQASARIEATHKRYIWEMRRTPSGKVYGNRRYCYVDAAGVESVLLRYGGRTPRHALLTALAAAST